MMFAEVINEGYDIEYHEDDGLGEPILKIIDKNKGRECRFFTEDIKIIIEFLNRLTDFGIKIEGE